MKIAADVIGWAATGLFALVIAGSSVPLGSSAFGAFIRSSRHHARERM
jgi:hypothetical protein